MTIIKLTTDKLITNYRALKAQDELSVLLELVLNAFRVELTNRGINPETIKVDQ